MRGNTTEYATVAQLVEQLIRNQQVAGSSPASSSTFTEIKTVNGKSTRYNVLCFFIAMVALFMMLVGALGMKIVPPNYFGVVERFSVFAATGFNAALGIHLFLLGYR